MEWNVPSVFVGKQRELDIACVLLSRFRCKEKKGAEGERGGERERERGAALALAYFPFSGPRYFTWYKSLR